MMKQVFLTLTCLFLAMFKILYDFSLYSVLFLVLFFFLGITSLLNYSRETVTFGILILVSVGLLLVRYINYRIIGLDPSLFVFGVIIEFCLIYCSRALLK